jgi:hypothetical protein
LPAILGGCAWAKRSMRNQIAFENLQASADTAPQGLNPSNWEELTVTKKEKVNHDTVFVRLAFKNSSAVSGLTTASCLLLKAPIGSQNEDGTKKDVIRPYTPVSDPEVRCAWAESDPMLGQGGHHGTVWTNCKQRGACAGATLTWW